MNSKHLCSHHQQEGKLCWLSVLVDPIFDQEEIDARIEIQDDVTICHDCDQFKLIKERGFGRRYADRALVTSVIKLIEQILVKNQNLEQTTEKLQKSLEQLGLLKDLTEALARSDRLEKSLRVILTGATSGQAFRFNRAAILLVNEQTSTLEGEAAVGPEGVEEAIRIWFDISKIPLSRLLEETLVSDDFIPCSLELAISTVKIPLSETSHPLIGVLTEAKERIIDTTDPEISRYDLSWWPLAHKIAVTPLISEDKPLGLILADNAISQTPITAESLDALKALANACSPSLQNAMLHQRLREQLRELERVHELFKANQEYLVRHERLADIGTLATKVAHEFRIPLVTIGGYARRILKTLGTDRFDKHMVEVVRSEVDRLTTLTSEILEYSRSSRLNIRECNINDLVGETLSHLRDKLNAYGVDTKQIYADKTLKVSVDPERFKQVILNLLDNAVDSMSKGGKLVIKTSKHREYVTLDIKDTGTGMSKESMKKLFTLFYTTKEKGSGLGLPVSKKIVDDHGGYINVTSTPGKGTVFSVSIPAAGNDDYAGSSQD